MSCSLYCFWNLSCLYYSGSCGGVVALQLGFGWRGFGCHMSTQLATFRIADHRINDCDYFQYLQQSSSSSFDFSKPIWQETYCLIAEYLHWHSWFWEHRVYGTVGTRTHLIIHFHSNAGLSCVDEWAFAIDGISHSIALYYTIDLIFGLLVCCQCQVVRFFAGSVESSHCCAVCHSLWCSLVAVRASHWFYPSFCRSTILDHSWLLCSGYFALNHFSYFHPFGQAVPDC